MNNFTKSIAAAFSGSAKAFFSFPAVIGCALGFSVVTLVRIYLDWPMQEPYNFLFNCLHWALALGAIAGMASITWARSRYDTKRSFLMANGGTLLLAVVAFLLLYFFGADKEVVPEIRYPVISVLAEARMTVAMVVAFLLFIIFAGYPKERSDFAKSFFMTHKAFFIALIYGVVLFGGTSGVARAVQALLYNDMSSKVYMVIGTLAGFIGFTIFVGYFPSFRKGEQDEHWEVAQKQPRFIEVLFGFIMVPILLALTVVLLLWAGKTAMSGMGASFILLSGIASAYAGYGLWLYFMVTHHETGLAKFYRKAYPIAALVILAFEAWALVVQLGKTGLQTVEYWFAIVWIVMVGAAFLLLLMKQRSYLIIILIICGFAVASVLPAMGYHALPVSAQTQRLETLLTEQGMLQENQISPAAGEIPLETREAITDAVYFLAYSRDASLPEWLDKNITDSTIFKKQLGFEPVWQKEENPFGNGGDYLNMSLNLPGGPVDISDYQWAINMQQEYSKVNTPVPLMTDRGTYQILWRMEQPQGKPSFRVTLDEQVVLESNMKDYIDQLTEKFPPGGQAQYKPAREDMTLLLESDELEAMLVFRYIDITLNVREDTINYWFDLDAIYLREKSVEN